MDIIPSIKVNTQIMVATKLLQYGVPGVYVNESTYGSSPVRINTHDAVYVFGTCSATIEPDKPVYCTSYEDFTNQCGLSPSAAAIKLYFDQLHGNGFWFIKVIGRRQVPLTLTLGSASTKIEILVNGESLAYTPKATDDAQSIGRGFAEMISTELAGLCTAFVDPSGLVVLRYADGLRIAAGSNVVLGNPTAAATYPTAYDVIDSVNHSLNPEDDQGFIVCPEFYAAYTSQSERTILQSQLDVFVAQPDFYWVHIVDCSKDVAKAINTNGLVSGLRGERSTFVSQRGNSWFYAPYFKAGGALVPPSLGVIGAGLRRARSQGIFQPFAGSDCQIYGIDGLSYEISRTQQKALNNLGINCIRRLPSIGVVPYGARTLSDDPFFTWCNERVVMNIAAGSLKKTYANIIFTLIDGSGALFLKVREKAEGICEELRQVGALYGATPSDAYLVICDNTNNSPAGIGAGTVYSDCIIKISPTLEILVSTLSKASIGTTLATVTTIAAGTDGNKSSGESTTK